MDVQSKKLTLKIDYQGDVRRLRNWPAGDSLPCAAELRTSVCQLFDLHLGENESLALKYRDDEGDLCTLVEPTMQDALTSAGTSGVLRLVASVVSDGSRCQEGPADSSEVSTPELRPLSRMTGFLSDRIADGQHRASHATTFLADRLSEGRQHASHATVFISDQLEEGRKRGSEQFAEIHRHTSEQVRVLHRNATEQFSETCKTATDHFEHVRPQLSHGVSHFKQQVTDDFKKSCKDMEDAFGVEEPQGKMKRTVRSVAGAATGLVAALKLAPVRATRLAAHSIGSLATVSPSQTVDTTEATTEASSSSNQNTTADHVDTTNDTASMSDVGFFKQQIKEDFNTAREDVKTAFTCILGERPPSQVERSAVDSSPTVNSADEIDHSADEHCEQQAEQASPQIGSIKTVIPDMVSAAAGVAFAAWLVPTRAARLAVATFAKDRTSSDGTAPLNAESRESSAQSSSNEPFGHSQPLIVESAFYGTPSNGDEERIGADVTDKVRSLVHNDELRINQGCSEGVMNDLLGDPAHGMLKVLEITCRYGSGPLLTQAACENDSLVITESIYENAQSS